MEKEFEPARRSPRILIFSDQPISRCGIAALVASMDDVEACREVASLDEALAAAPEFGATLVIVDIAVPKGNAPALTDELLRAFPHLQILVVSSHGDSLHALEALRVGGRGFFIKSHSLAELAHAIRAIAAGETYIPVPLRQNRVFQSLLESDPTYADKIAALSPRESDVFLCLAQGMSTLEAAEALKISAKTVETHRVHLKVKLGFILVEDLIDFAKEWAAAEKLRLPGTAPRDPATPA